jgi:murein DD-endopeptidase MepM/ murein hydrolase activator NlpD
MAVGRRRAAVLSAPVGALLAVVAAMLAPAGPLAAADDLDDKRERVDQQIDEVGDDLNQSTKALNEATEAYEQAESQLPGAEGALGQAEAELAAAQDELDRAQGEVAAAKAEDARAAERLSDAEERVREQLAKIDALNAEIDEQDADMARLASAAYRRGSLGRLHEVATVITAPTLGELSSRIGYTRSIMNADDVELTAMKGTRAELANERVRLDELRDEAERLRIEAAEHLKRTEELEAAAQQAAADAAARAADARAAKEAVDTLVRQREQALAAADDAREADAAAYAELQAERSHIDAEIKELARKRAEEERKRREAEEQAARDGSSGSSSGSSGGSSSSGGSASASSSPLAYPVANPYVTSSYGMRVHPITGVYKLHDGTDLRAYCGTPIRAAHDGRVEWATYRGGYGNQVLVDHGTVQGNHLMTSYSHLSRFALSSGARVSQGQVIGYSGTTGYSTACHLHFMVYANGSRTNPMNYL